MNSSYGGLRGEKEKLEVENSHLQAKLYQSENDRACEQNEWQRYKEDQKQKARDT